MVLTLDFNRSWYSRGHITDTKCRPDIIAAFDRANDNTTLWPCIQLAGEQASKGETPNE